jgi:hypothetical protein
MLPFHVPIEFDPSLQERYVGEDKVDVDLVAAPYQEMHRRLAMYRVQVLPYIVEAEKLDRLLRDGFLKTHKSAGAFRHDVEGASHIEAVTGEAVFNAFQTDSRCLA